MVLALPLIIGKLTVASTHTTTQDAGLWLLYLLPLPDLFNLRLRLETVTFKPAPEILISTHQIIVMNIC